MKDLIKENAFGILGLLPDATQKEISKKGKELSKLLKFGDKILYPLDMDFYSSYRNENLITESINELSLIRTHMLHAFFRIYPISEKENEEILSLAKLPSVSKRVNNIAENKIIKERNKLILLLICLYQSDSKITSKQIMQQLNTVLEDFVQKETIITDFKKLYKLTDELGINDKIFASIKEDIFSNLIYIFSNISEYKKNDNIIYEALKYLSNYIKSYKEIPLLSNFLTNIIKSIEDIRNTSIEDMEKNKSEFRQKLLNIQLLFNQSLDMNIFDSLFFLDYRDEFCKTLSEKSVDYFNSTGNIEVSLGLVRVAQNVGGFISTNSKLKESVETLIKIKQEDSTPFVEFYLKKKSPYPKFCFYNSMLKVYTKEFFGDISCQELLYKDIEGYGFYILEQSISGIPSAILHDLKILANQRHYTYSCNTSGWTADDSQNTDFYAILGVLDKIVKPQIIKSIIYKIFTLNDKYFIGNVCFNKEGMSARGIFSKKKLAWKNVKYKAVICSGFVVIYDENKREFSNIRLDNINAPIIPDLIQEIILQLNGEFRYEKN